MSQIHCSVAPDVEGELRARAKARKLPLSKYVAEVLTKEVRRGWPPGWFERVAGSWKGPLERPPQGKFEKRTPL
jgi:post-segregation antitoxin (ccd killing protein)